MATQAVEFSTIISESRRILSAHSRHFLAHSVLFLLPLSFLLLAAPIFLDSISYPDTNGTEALLYSETPLQTRTLLFSLLYALSIILLSLSATGAVTHSILHGFFGRPVKLVSALFSLSSSLWRLSLTFCVLSLVWFTFCILVYLGLYSLSFLGYHISLQLQVTISLILLGFLLMCLQANFALAPVVVVAESNWGFEPLRRSSYLLAGARKTAIWLGLLFSLMIGLMFWCANVKLDEFEMGSTGIPVAQTMFALGVVMVVILYVLATNTVLYMYCKALKGELAGEIVAEFAWEYVCLPFDDQKVPHVVTMDRPSEEQV